VVKIFLLNIRKRFVKHIVNVAIAPIFAFLERFDNRVIGCVEMFGRMFVWRRITAADVTTHFAQTQMNPPIAGFQTIFAAVSARRNLFDFFKMFAAVHFYFPWVKFNLKLFYRFGRLINNFARQRHESFI
jgi:hypothetical protein